MVAKIKVKVDFKRKAIVKAMKKANFNSLGRAGAFVRQTMRRSIRKRKKSGKPSSPGSPPKTSPPAFAMRNAILFEVSRQQDEVVVGPTLGGFGTIGKVQEEGGISIGRTFKKVKGRRVQTGRVRRRYPKRPFAAPALIKSQPRLSRFWANSIRS